MLRPTIALFFASRAAGFGVMPATEPVATEAPSYKLPLSAETVHWGYFSKDEPPKLTVTSGAVVEVEMASHHACDDYDKMIKGDPGMESVFEWSTSTKAVVRRGASGGGDGVHVLTGPIYVEDTAPGDILKVEILDLKPRPNAEGKTYGSNAAAWWGFQARSNKVHGHPSNLEATGGCSAHHLVSGSESHSTALAG